MSSELGRYLSANEHLRLDVEELRLKEGGLEREMLARTSDRAELEARLRRLKTDLHDVFLVADDPKALKLGVKRLYQRYWPYCAYCPLLSSPTPPHHQSAVPPAPHAST